MRAPLTLPRLLAAMRVLREDDEDLYDEICTEFAPVLADLLTDPADSLGERLTEELYEALLGETSPGDAA
jgi:hypothetical protein